MKETSYEKMLETADLIAKESLSEQEMSKLEENLSSIQEEFPDHKPTEEDLELEKRPQQINVTIDENGKINNVINTDINTSDKTLDDLMNSDIMDTKINPETIEGSLKSLFPVIEDVDVPMFMIALKRYQNKEKFSYFNAFPEKMKSQVDMVIGGANSGYATQPEARNYVTRILFDQVIYDNFVDHSFTDLEKSINKTYEELYENTKDDFSKYGNNQRAIMETKLKEIAEEETDEEKKQKLLKVSEMFHESYTYTGMINKYKNTGKLKIKPIEIDKFERECKEWCYKYKDTEEIINNPKDLLQRLTWWNKENNYNYDEKTLKKFILIFLKYSKDMKPKNIEEHVFMYYFIKNILTLKFVNKDNKEEYEFYESVQFNIKKMLDLIVEKDKEKK